MKSTIHFEVPPFKETAICGTPNQAAGHCPRGAFVGRGWRSCLHKKKRETNRRSKSRVFVHPFFSYFFIPECVARVPVSLWGSGGWGCVRSTLRLWSQPSVRGPYGRAYGKFCRGGHFWRFQTCGCFVSRGRRGTSWHSDVFYNVLKIVLRGRRNTFATFSEDVLQFSWQAQHFGRVHRHFSWQAQHFRRVLLRVFCKSHWQGCVKWRQGANSVAGVAFCAMCWKFTEASHETSILRLQIFRF